MPIELVPVTGSVLLPNGLGYAHALEFQLSEADRDGPDALAQAPVRVALADGALPPGFTLWRNMAGERGTLYEVTAYVTTLVAGGQVTLSKPYRLGRIQVGNAATYTLGELLAEDAGPAPVWIVNLDPAQYAALQAEIAASAAAAATASAAAVTAVAAAAILEGFAIPDWGTFTTNSALNNGRGPYALPYDPVAVEYIDLTVDDVWQVPGTGFTLVYSGPTAQILLSFDTPSGIVCNFRLQRPLVYDPNATIMTPQNFEATGSGVANDTAAMQAFFSWFGTARAAGPVEAKIPAGRYLITDRITCTANSGFRSVLDWDGAEFICDFDRAPGKYEFLYFGDPAAPSDYQAAIDIRGRAYFTRGANCTYPPVAVRAPAWAQSTMQGVNAGSWGNTIVDFTGAQNIECSDWTIYSGGYSFPYLETGSSLYRQTGTNLVRVAGSVDFPTSCVGKTIEITAGSDSRKTRITARLSATSVTVENTATDTVDQAVYFGSPAVTTTSGSATVTLDGAVTSDMVGLLVGIPFAGANERILWATVTAVDTGAGTLTLDKTAGQTLNPVANPLTQTTEIATPAVALRSEKISDGGLFTNGISQVRFNNLQIETYRGVALGIDDAEFLHFNQAKFHGISTPAGSIYGLAHMWGNQVGGSFIGEFDQRTMGRWKMVFARQTQAFTFLSLTARTRDNELLLGIGPNASGFPGAEINFNNVTLTGIDAATFAPLVDDRTSTGGYIAPLRFFVPDGDATTAYLNRSVYADAAGALYANSLVMPAPVPIAPVVADASSGGNVASVGSANGISQRIGNLMFFSMRILDINTTGLTPANNLVVRPLPAALRGGTFNTFNAAMRINGMTFALPPTAFADDGDTHILFYQPVSGGTATLMTVASLASGTADLYISGSYFV